MDQKHNGAHNELIATCWLLKQGFEVFRNVSPHGDVDIIALKDGNLTLFDVKKIHRRLDGTPSTASLTSAQIDLGVKLLCVSDDDACHVVDIPRLKGGEMFACETCGAQSKQRNWRQRFCSTECKGISEAPMKRLAHQEKKTGRKRIEVRPDFVG